MKVIIKNKITKILDWIRINSTINRNAMPFIVYSSAIIIIIITGLFIGLMYRERGLITIIILFTVLGFLALIVLRKLSRAYVKIDNMGITDELTRLYDRRYFFSRLKEIHNQAKRYNHPMSCILIDIDNFKRINDTYGHQTGDAVLGKISDMIKNNCRKTDIIARFGGEEIIILLPETISDDAFVLAEKLRNTIDKNKIKHEKRQLRLTISLGVAGFPENEIGKIEDTNILIQRADDALYAAKNKGKNRVEFYE